jgi:bifunctional non-homologous end joining protein LigD
MILAERVHRLSRKAIDLLRRVFPPMLATLSDEPPADDDAWVYEIKYDGFRAVVGIADGDLAMWSRNELDLRSRFPKIAQQLSKLKLDNAVLDGEIVATDAAGVPRFQLLQGGASETIFFFDILWLDGKDLRKHTCEERRAILEKVLRKAPAQIAPARRLEMSGAEALKLAAEAGYEGVIAKRKTSTYQPRRSKEWLKLKALKGQELAIIGWNPSTHSTKEIGALHLAYVDEHGEFRYAGKVGTGFSAKLRTSLREVLERDVVPAPVAKDAPRIRVATWVRPRLVAQVAFTEWTDDNRLRHPSFLGLRDDKSPEEVVREQAMHASDTKKKRGAAGSTRATRKPSKDAEAESSPARVSSAKKPVARATKAVARSASAKTESAKPAVRSSPKPAQTEPPVVKLSHPERVLYPKDGVTKQDVADYYAAVAEAMIATLADRPLTLEHWNSGIEQPSWFQQNIGREAPDWATIIDTPTRVSSRKTIRHLVADRPETLQWLAQMSVLTIHMWSSRGESLEEADWVVFDLDPAKGKGIEQAIEAAIVMRGLLENLELPSVPKTSGKRGIHVFVPLKAGQSHEAAVEFATSIAAGVAQHVPDITVERAIAQRNGRLYLDALQNGYGKTIVAPYSLRGIAGAPVSAPLKWSEVTRRLDPTKFNIRTMPARLARLGDLFAPLALGKGVKLPALR